MNTMKRRLTSLVTITCLWAATCAVTGCTPQEKVNVAQNILNWIPALQSTVGTIDATGALLDPAAAPIFALATAGMTAAGNLLVPALQAYIANPTAPALTQIQIQVATFQQSINSAVLQAARIVDPASQQKALLSINGIGTIVSAILALVTSIKGNTPAVAASVVTVKTSQIQPILDRPELRRQTAQIIAEHYAVSAASAQSMVQAGRMELAHAGF